MKNLGQNFALLGLLTYGSVELLVNHAFGNTQSDELYSESIYIYKPKAEIPSSLDASDSVELAETPKFNPPARSKKHARN